MAWLHKSVPWIKFRAICTEISQIDWWTQGILLHSLLGSRFQNYVIALTTTLPKLPKKSCLTFKYFPWSPLVLIMAHIRHGIICICLCNVTTFICIIFHQDLVMMVVRPPVKSSSAHPKIFYGVTVYTLWWPIHGWKWCLMLSEPLFHNLSPMNADIVILWYARAIGEEKNPLMEIPIHLVYSGRQLNSFANIAGPSNYAMDASQLLCWAKSR